ncbi:hypothetical protein CSH63_22040 [Micromonospora tulbaghiae]|uniref:Uncharacterized protein n=1 Tax=Micromonospora tulbaghiae TaxID=479978 RepID=A0A386WRS6_9ACTN|nr:hypothetical protein [Micromonospora tulbaghiae]AYF30079.1 hypothetical protein CSH63_22040 [Micromonospora tulbaghiae]NED51628.1 hypothetical protein [Micromonospora aurantiaca]
MIGRARRATITQAALVAVIVGVMLMLLGGGGANRRPEQIPARTVRPATVEERRPHQVDELRKCLRGVERCQQAGQGIETR